MKKQKTDQGECDTSLALELSELGLSLFHCAGDEPLECIKHVNLDDPEFARKVGLFREAAEQAEGKQFETEIWLPDEQVMFRSLMLDDEGVTSRRHAAVEALSASTPFPGDALCFDLGDTNGAGYTPVAAIPKEKMDEAMAFAKKMRMNPKLVTTSNVVSGFAARPEFAPYQAEKSKRMPFKVAAAAAILAAPVALLSIQMDRGLTPIVEPVQAMIAWVDGLEADTEGPTKMGYEEIDPARAVLPGLNGVHDYEVEAPIIEADDQLTNRESSVLPDNIAVQTSLEAFEGFLPETDLASLKLASLGTAPRINPQPIPLSEGADLFGSGVSVQFTVKKIAEVSGEAHQIELGQMLGFSGGSIDAPAKLLSVKKDDLPSNEMLSIAYVNNVFDRMIVIRDLVAIDEAQEYPKPVDVDQFGFFRVANIAEGILVRRPGAREVSRLVQPSFMPRPEKRPPPPLPEEVFDINSIVNIQPEMVVEDPEPLVVSVNDPSVELASPEGLVVILDKDLEYILEKETLRARETASLRAQQNSNDPFAKLPRPPLRDLMQLEGTLGGLVQILHSDVPAVQLGINAIQVPTAPNAVVRTGKKLKIATRFEGEVPLPRFLSMTDTENDNLSLSRSDLSVSSSDAVEPKLHRPPSRRALASVLEADEADTDNPSPLPQDAALDTTDLILNLSIPRPPVRPTFGQETNVAALISELRPAEVDNQPISKVALGEVFSPVQRPPSLLEQARKIIKDRSSVTAVVAKKQEPVSSTSQERLRIPTSARVATVATIEDGINLGDLSLIGIYGTSKTRRALVRLPQGRYVQISRGDEVRGWTVSAVSDDAVRIQRGSKSKILRLPN